MPLSKTTISCLIDDEDLVTAVVAVSPLGVRVRRGPRIESYATRPPDDLRRALESLPRFAEILLMVPGSMCALRPVPLSRRTWLRSRAEILSSIQGLFPIPKEQAVLSYLERAQSPASPDRGDAGYLVALTCAALQPHLDTLESAFCRPVKQVLSSHAGLLGLGLQIAEHATVLDRAVGAETVHHTLNWGRIETLDEQSAPVTDLRPALFALPGAAAPESATRIPAHELAAGGPIALHIAPESISPFFGRTPASHHRWAAPAASAATAALLAFGAHRVIESRYAAAADRIRVEQVALADELAAVEAMRARSQELIARLGDVARETVDWHPSIPTIAAAYRAVPEGAFVHRFEIEGGEINISGEAPSAGDVLRSLQSSTEFVQPRRVSTSAPTERGESFEVRAGIAGQTNAREDSP